MCPHLSLGLQEVTGKVGARMDSWVLSLLPVSARRSQRKRFVRRTVLNRKAITAEKLFPHIRLLTDCQLVFFIPCF